MGKRKSDLVLWGASMVMAEARGLMRSQLKRIQVFFDLSFDLSKVIKPVRLKMISIV